MHVQCVELFEDSTSYQNLEDEERRKVFDEYVAKLKRKQEKGDKHHKDKDKDRDKDEKKKDKKHKHDHDDRPVKKVVDAHAMGMSLGFLGRVDWGYNVYPSTGAFAGCWRRLWGPKMVVNKESSLFGASTV